jgi:hypothetical protein
MNRLKLAIPNTEEGFTAEFMGMFPALLNVEEAVLGIAEMFTEAELIATLGEVFPIVSGVIGLWLSLGSSYAAGRAEIAKESIKSGFARGVVTAADAGKARLLEEYFWRSFPDPSPFDQEVGTIAQHAYNQGLIAGFMQAHELTRGKSVGFAETSGIGLPISRLEGARTAGKKMSGSTGMFLRPRTSDGSICNSFEISPLQGSAKNIFIQWRKHSA